MKLKLRMKIRDENYTFFLKFLFKYLNFVVNKLMHIAFCNNYKSFKKNAREKKKSSGQVGN